MHWRGCHFEGAARLPCLAVLCLCAGGECGWKRGGGEGDGKRSWGERGKEKGVYREGHHIEGPACLQAGWLANGGGLEAWGEGAPEQCFYNGSGITSLVLQTCLAGKYGR